MKNHLYEMLLNYRWGHLWLKITKTQNPGVDEKLLKAYLLSAMWGEHDAARSELRRIENNTSSLFLWVWLMIDLSSDINNSDKKAGLKKIGALNWMLDWHYLELYGRARQYKKQAKYYKKIINKGHIQDSVYIGILQSTNSLQIQESFLLNVLNKHYVDSNLYHLTLCWLNLNKNSTYKVQTKLVDESIPIQS